MQLTSSVFQQGAEIPSYYTSDGEDASPELSWKDAPAETKSFALIVHDPDASRPGGFTHWVVYDIPPETGHIEENVPDTERVSGLGTQGKNDGGKIGDSSRLLRSQLIRHVVDQLAPQQVERRLVVELDVVERVGEDLGHPGEAGRQIVLDPQLADTKQQPGDAQREPRDAHVMHVLVP